MKLNLQDVTICSADCINPQLAVRAIKQSMQVCDFGETIIFSDKLEVAASKVKFHEINKLNSRNHYSRFILKELHEYIQTPYVLLVQWDGYVIDASAWQSDYFKYDLIGAKWHWHKDGRTVGNGGFTLRSLKLLKAIASDQFPFLEDVNEDEQICRIYHDRLVSEFGIKFAPENIADKFSYERALPASPTFGFHGLFNIWRHLEDEEVISLLKELNPHVFNSVEFYELFLQYFILRKFEPLQALYKIVKVYRSTEQIFNRVLGITKDANLSKYLINLCEDIHKK